MSNSTNKRVKYDVYKYPNGLLYRVPLHSALYENVEFYTNRWRCWFLSAQTVVGVITSSESTLVARNVVFKD